MNENRFSSNVVDFPPRRVGNTADLNFGGGGGTSDAMVPIKDYVDARDEAVESRLMAKMDTLATKGTIWGAVATAVAIALAVVAFAGDRFDSGLSIAEQQQAQLERDQQQDVAAKRTQDSLDRLIAKLDAQQGADKR